MKIVRFAAEIVSEVEVKWVKECSDVSFVKFAARS